MTYYGIVTLFVHVHIEEGTTFIHSHPFARSADGTCHHHATLAEIQLFHILSTITAGDGAVHSLQLCLLVTPIRLLAETPVYPDYPVADPGQGLLRAPPVC